MVLYSAMYRSALAVTLVGVMSLSGSTAKNELLFTGEKPTALTATTTCSDIADVESAYHSVATYWDTATSTKDTTQLYFLRDAVPASCEVGHHILPVDGEGVIIIEFEYPESFIVINRAGINYLKNVASQTGIPPKDAFFFALGHEYGHAIQKGDGTYDQHATGDAVTHREQQADCYAGVMIANVLPQLLPNVADFYNALASQSGPLHGTPQDRIAHFELGALGGYCA